MNIQDQSKHTTPSGNGVHICHRCEWPFPNSHPTSKHRRAHKRICGTIEGYTNKLIHSETLSDDDDDDEHHSDYDDDKVKTPSPKIEKRIIKESGSGTGGGGGTEERSIKSEEDLFSSKHVDDTFEVTDNKDQEKEVVDVLSVATDIPLVDHAETLIDDFKDHKSVYSNVPRGENDDEIRSMMDSFEVKTVEETIQESQTSENGESTVSEHTKTEGVGEETNRGVVKKAVIDDSGPVLTEVKQPESGIAAKQKTVESGNADSKDSGKVVISDSLEKAEQSRDASGVVSGIVVDEGDVKLMTSQDCGIDASIGSSSRNSLEGNWGSVSVLSTASIDAENAHSIGKSDISSDKSGLGKSEAFEGPSFVAPKEKTVDQKASEIKADTVQNSQPPKSEANMSNEKRNVDAIAKVTNWTTNENPLSEAKSSNPKQLSTMIQKDEAAEKTSESGKSNLVNQDSSPTKFIGDGKKVEKKSKRRASWKSFVCCSSVNVN